MDQGHANQQGNDADHDGFVFWEEALDSDIATTEAYDDNDQ